MKLLKNIFLYFSAFIPLFLLLATKMLVDIAHNTCPLAIHHAKHAFQNLQKCSAKANLCCKFCKKNIYFVS